MTDQRTRDPGLVSRGGRGLAFTASYLLGMILLYVGERLAFDSTATRVGLAVVAGVAFIAALAGRFHRLRIVAPMARAVEHRILLAYAIGLLALVLYGVQSDMVMDRLRPLFEQPRSAERFEAIFAVLWVIVWICSILPLIFVELSYAPMDTARTVDMRRIGRSLNSGLIIAMSAGLLFVLNYISNEFNQKFDLSYFKTTQPSESSKRMVASLSEPLKVTLFFPSNNEVLDHAGAFFDDLKSESKLFHVRVVDHTLEPKLAKELSANGNGAVVFSRDEKRQNLFLGPTLRQAKAKLKRLDQEFQTIFLKLARSKKVAYLTVGHRERAQDDPKRQAGEGVRLMRQGLRQLNYVVKELGLVQGLGSAVPNDATLVIIIGPRDDFMPSEIEALAKYANSGGRLLAFLDPESGITLDPLFARFGLKVHAEPLAVSRPLAQLRRNKSDRHIIVTNSFGTHDSVKTISRNSHQLALVFLGTGYLKKVSPPKDESGAKKTTKIQFTIRSRPQTWNDANGNFDYDRDSEKYANYDVAAAITKTVASKTKATPARSKQEADGANEMRIVVVADADIISDKLLRALGNRYLMVDAVKWLGGEEKFIGKTSSEEDVRFTHTRKEDKIWFYLTILAIPALVLAVGLIFTRRRRKQR